jgi:hypothetical protein
MYVEGFIVLLNMYRPTTRLSSGGSILSTNGVYLINDMYVEGFIVLLNMFRPTTKLSSGGGVLSTNGVYLINDKLIAF